jgi:hypothetical protein
MGGINSPLGLNTFPIGGNIAGGTQGSVLFVGASAVLAQDNAKLSWNDSGNLLSVSDGTQGFQLGAYVNGIGYGAIYPYGVTASSINYSLAISNGSTILNSISTIGLSISGTNKLFITTGGATVLLGGFDGMGNTWSARGVAGDSLQLGVDNTNHIGNLQCVSEGVGWRQMNYGALSHNFFLSGYSGPSFVIQASGFDFGGPVRVNGGSIVANVNSGGFYARTFSGSGDQAFINFGNSGADKWQFGKQTDDTMFLYDIANSRNLFQSASGNFVVGGGGSGVSMVIGTTAAQASALLTMFSTTQGFLPPRMTTTQKNAISSPATGLVVYDNTLNKLCVYTGAAWQTVTSV